MRVTVLMPVYNGKQFLKEAIESILAQTFADFEFLIIDDGSTDESREIIKSFSDKRIRLVKNQGNQGLVVSLNKGIELARGEYVVRMDSDDVSVPERIEKQVDFMDEHPDIGIAGSWIKKVKGTETSVVEFPTEAETIKCRLLFETVLAHPSVVMRKAMLTQKGLKYDRAYERCEDYDLWVRASGKECKLANIPETLVLYGIHAGQVGQKYDKMQQYGLRQIHRRQIKALGICPSEEELTLHRSIGKKIIQYRKSYLSEVNQWLAKLKAANDRRRIYPEPQFSEILAYYREGAEKSKVSFREWFWRKAKNLI